MYLCLLGQHLEMKRDLLRENEELPMLQGMLKGQGRGEFWIN